MDAARLFYENILGLEILEITYDRFAGYWISERHEMTLCISTSPDEGIRWGASGNGVWTMGMRNPEYFTALAPLGGYIYPFGVPENICTLKDVPIWAFHGEADFMVPPNVEQNLVDAVNACGGTAKITIKSGAVIPLDVYHTPELFDWFLAQSKK